MFSVACEISPFASTHSEPIRAAVLDSTHSVRQLKPILCNHQTIGIYKFHNIVKTFHGGKAYELHSSFSNFYIDWCLNVNVMGYFFRESFPNSNWNVIYHISGVLLLGLFVDFKKVFIGNWYRRSGHRKGSPGSCFISYFKRILGQSGWSEPLRAVLDWTALWVCIFIFGSDSMNRLPDNCRTLHHRC